jgi:hypothetical protein
MSTLRCAISHHEMPSQRALGVLLAALSGNCLRLHMETSCEGFDWRYVKQFSGSPAFAG